MVDAISPVGELSEALKRPETYAHRPASVEVRETHISWVFLAGDRAYKLKKPLVLDFLDYGSAARRRQMCREEVRLNRRLAPGLYLGVRSATPTSAGFALGDEDDPNAVDYLVEMRRYDERDTLAARLSRGELREKEMYAVSARLARFHARARRVRSRDSLPIEVERRFEQNIHEMMTWVGQRGEAERVLALERFAHAFLVAHRRELHERARRGCVREGHGDLRAEHVLVNGEVQVVDCVEFDRKLRELDVADDLAFLLADLASLGGAHFGEALVEGYRAAGGDPGPDELLAFYAAYRALIRAKVSLVRARQHRPGSAASGSASRRGRDLIAVAEQFAWRARLPLLIAVCGRPASGKSTLARALAATSGLPHLSSDVTRKQLAQIRPSVRGGSEIYSQKWNARTYAELGRRATAMVQQSRGAIVDATFRHRCDRDAFRSGLEVLVPVLFIECDAPPPVLAERARNRDRDHARVSDADLEVVRTAGWETLDEVPAREHLALRTDRTPEEIVGDILALLDQRLIQLAR